MHPAAPEHGQDHDPAGASLATGERVDRLELHVGDRGHGKP
jgi:hypothetical protein